MPKKAPPGPLEYLRRWQMQAWLAAVFVFLYAPLIALGLVFAPGAIVSLARRTKA